MLPEEMAHLERVLPPVDKANHPITDYAGTKFSPTRQYELRCAEVDYVNGIPAVNEDGIVGTHYPSQVEICEKYNLPTKLVADQAVKYNWAKRRKHVQHGQNVYETLKRVKVRRERADALQTLIIEGLERLQVIGQHQIWELEERMRREQRTFKQAQESGDFDYVPDAGIRNADVEGLSRTLDHISKSRDRIVAEIDRQDKDAIEASILEIEKPEPLPAAQDEEKLKEIADSLAKAARDEAREAGVSEEDLQTVVQMMLNNEQINRDNASRAARTIAGEVEGGDENDDV